MIQAKGIEKSFGTLKVLKGLDFSVGTAEVVSIMGASGAGKSTLLQILGTLSSPDAGSLLIDGVDVLKLKGDKLAEFIGDERLCAQSCNALFYGADALPIGPETTN